MGEASLIRMQGSWWKEVRGRFFMKQNMGAFHLLISVMESVGNFIFSSSPWSQTPLSFLFICMRIWYFMFIQVGSFLHESCSIYCHNEMTVNLVLRHGFFSLWVMKWWEDFVGVGNGTLVWADSDDIVKVDLQRGDVYRLETGSVFYLQSKSNSEAEEEKLRIHAVFTNTEEGLYVRTYKDILFLSLIS